MCGFVCIINFNNNFDSNIVKNLKYASNHRGPDNTDHITYPNCLLFFRRLSIIDLSERSNQPITNKQENISVVLNGEIYNYLEIKKELLNLGYIFKTSGDSEVLIKSYEQWGESCVDKLRGMFSFCIWDSKKNEFFAYRDRFGIKPLFYKIDGDDHIFSSEIKDIHVIKNLKKENNNSIFKYFSKGFLDDTEDTFFQDIKSIKPSHYVKLQSNKTSYHKYWNLELDQNNSFNKEEFRHHFDESMKLHLRSDVPIAFALSGGLDSNSITAVASKFLNDKNKLKAFSVSPPNTFDESFWIDKATQYYNLDHSYVDIEKENISEYFDKILYFHDEPFHSSSIFYHFLMREKIHKEGFKVLMVGEGADEVLSGYRRMLFPYLYDLESRKLLVQFDETIENSEMFMEVDKSIVKKNYLIFKSRLDSNKSDSEFIDNYKFLNKDFIETNSITASLRYNLDNYNKKDSTLKQSLCDHIFKRDLPYVLRMEDRNSMGNSIESRVPFLDHKFVEYIFSIDPKYFMQGGENKKMLRESMKKNLPKEVYNRKSKSARPGSDSYFMDHSVKIEFLDLLNSCGSANNFIDVEAIKNNILEDDSNKKINNSILEFRIYSYLKWKNINFSSY